MADAVVTNLLALAKNKQRAAAETPAAPPSFCKASSPPTNTAYVLIPLANLIPYDRNPFALYEDERLEQLVESIRENGIITPLIARPLERGEYQILSGHNRHNAARLVGLETVPCFVRDADEEEALGIVLESNFTQRSITDMRPSELAKSFQMQVEWFKSSGKRNDLVQQIRALMEDKYGEEESPELDENSTSSHGDRRLKNDHIINLSDSTRRRYMRLNLLDEDLLALVDTGYLTVSYGVQLSYLRAFEQELIVSFLEENTAEFDKKKIARLRELSKENALNAQKICAILLERETKKEFVPKITKPSRTIRNMFPAGTKPKTIESTIVSALTLYFEKAPKEETDETE